MTFCGVLAVYNLYRVWHGREDKCLICDSHSSSLLSILLFLFFLCCTALLGRGTRAPEADPHESVHHVHVRQHHLHLPHHDGLHDGVEAHTGTHVHVCQWVSSSSILNVQEMVEQHLKPSESVVDKKIRHQVVFLHAFVLLCLSLQAVGELQSAVAPGPRLPDR